MMGFSTKAALLAALMGSAMPAALSAQTTDAPAAPATTPASPATTPATTPAADAASTPAGEATTGTATKDTETKAGETAPAADAAAAPSADAPAAKAPDAAAATTPAATAPDAPAAGTPPAALPTGATPANPAKTAAEAQVGGFYLDQAQGDWQVRCQKTADGKDPCELYQLMRDAQNNPVAEISLIPLSGKAAAGATLVAPLETDLLPGLGFRVDAGAQKAYPFSFCTQVGCFSRVAMSQPEIDALRKGTKATVSLLPFGAPADGKVDLNLSLKGFSAGWDAVKAKSPAPAAEPVKK